MSLEVIITGLIGTLTTGVSSWVSWILARRKYNSEVDNNLINNMKESLDFYRQLSDDNKSRLEDVLKRNEALEMRDEKLEEEVKNLREQVFKLMSSICLDLTCKIRQKEVFKSEKK